MQENINTLLKLTGQMSAMVTVLSVEDFWSLPPKVRYQYIWIMADLAEEACQVAEAFEPRGRQSHGL